MDIYRQWREILFALTETIKLFGLLKMLKEPLTAVMYWAMQHQIINL